MKPAKKKSTAAAGKKPAAKMKPATKTKKSVAKTKPNKVKSTVGTAKKKSEPKKKVEAKKAKSVVEKSKVAPKSKSAVARQPVTKPKQMGKKVAVTKAASKAKPKAAPTKPVKPKQTKAQKDTTNRKSPAKVVTNAGAKKPKPTATKTPAAKAVAKPVAKKKPATKLEATSKRTATTKTTATKKAPKKKEMTAKKKTRASSSTRRSVKVDAEAKQQVPDIPAILLEGDEPNYTGPSGPGARYVSTGSTVDDQDLTLPDAYGTKRIHLVARDPQWLYAHWDLTAEQLQSYNQLARSGQLTLQVFEDDIAGAPKVEIEVHPESRSWFVHVGKGGGNYFAVLGFHDKLGDWQEIAVSDQAITPPDSLSDDLEATFASIPVTVSFSKLIEVVREYAANEPKLAKALNLIQQSSIPETAGFFTAATPSIGSPRWSEAQQQALADAVTMEEVRRSWIGSQEILELLKGREALSSEAAIPPGGISSLSSPHGGLPERGERGFWFNVNAELIVYGATEPDATVTIGGRQIKLREDGTFSYRFALPDGQYQLPIAATSADKVETRNADLEFARSTEYRGDVGQHPQDGNLKKPSSENVS